MNEVVVLLGAEIDLQTAYERLTTAGRNEAFETLVRDAFEQLSQFPNSGSVFLGGFRRLVLAPLTYGFFYRVEGRRTIIHALLDLRQSPDAIRQRLSL